MSGLRARCVSRTKWKPSASSPGGLAHDFKNLLAGISGSLELIRMRRVAQHRSAATSRPQNLNVLFITGYAESAAIGDGLVAQGQGMQVMTKPFALDALAANIQGIIGR